MREKNKGPFQGLLCSKRLRGFPKFGVPYWGPHSKGILLLEVKFGVPYFRPRRKFLICRGAGVSVSTQLLGAATCSRYPDQDVLSFHRLRV